MLILSFILITDEPETVIPTIISEQNAVEISKKKNTEDCPTCDCICPKVESIPSLFSNNVDSNLKFSNNADSNKRYSNLKDFSSTQASWTLKPEHNNDQLIQRTFDDSMNFNSNELTVKMLHFISKYC